MIDRTISAMRPMGNSLSSQMAALEAAARDRDEDSQSPGDSNSNKGKCEIKQESGDAKHEMDEDSRMDGNSNSGGGKNASNDMGGGNVKTEIKTEPMDQSDAGGSGISDSLVKGEIKDEPMSPSNESKPDVKPVVLEPIQPNALDKKKKCRKYLVLFDWNFLPFI